MMYHIGEFSRLTGLSIHTLRYYEKENLITPERGSGKKRCYTDADLNWIAFIKRLKETGMSIEDIKTYSGLRSLGDSTLSKRMVLLEAHKVFVEDEIRKWQDNLSKLNDKIDYYKDEIKKHE